MNRTLPTPEQIRRADEIDRARYAVLTWTEIVGRIEGEIKVAAEKEQHHRLAALRKRLAAEERNLADARYRLESLGNGRSTP